MLPAMCKVKERGIAGMGAELGVEKGNGLTTRVDQLFDRQHLEPPSSPALHPWGQTLPKLHPQSLQCTQSPVSGYAAAMTSSYCTYRLTATA